MTTATDPALRLSVVIPTWNRSEVLATTLERLSAQTLRPEEFEVLVVDDGSTDGTRPTVEALAGAMPYALRYLRHENRGPGYTQNRGILEARADLVLIMTDDLWATPHLLRTHVEAHERDPGANIAVLGRVEQAPELPATVLHRHWDPFSFDELSGRRELTSLHFYASNISFHAGFLRQHGLFRERTGAANEDTELGYRLSRSGLRILHEPRALGHHFHPESLDSICRRAYEQGRNFDLLDEVPRREILPFCGIFTLEAGPAQALRALPKAILRWCLFNAWMVDFAWRPVLELAEGFPPARLFARRGVYRGVFGCYYRRGIRDLRRAQGLQVPFGPRQSQ